MKTTKTYNCPFEITLEAIGGKWKSLILWHLFENGTLRNGQMLRLMPHITQKMLTQQLREMEASGLVTRKIYEQVPPKVEYSLTQAALQLEPIMNLMMAWGMQRAEALGLEAGCTLEG